MKYIDVYNFKINILYLSQAAQTVQDYTAVKIDSNLKDITYENSRIIFQM